MWSHPSHNLISNPTIKSPPDLCFSFQGTTWAAYAICYCLLKCGMAPGQQVRIESHTTAKGHFITRGARECRSTGSRTKPVLAEF